MCRFHSAGWDSNCTCVMAPVTCLHTVPGGSPSSAWIVPKSKPWWSEDCQDAFSTYSLSQMKEDWSAFRCAVHDTKRDFFAKRIQEVTVTNMCPWDLMEWVKQHKNPPCEVIQHNGEPCHDLEQLCGALHGTSTYNAALGHQCNISMLKTLPDHLVWEWAPFLVLELTQALGACSSNSAPRLDHVTWVHLKCIVTAPGCLDVFLMLASGCLQETVCPWLFPNLASHCTLCQRHSGQLCF